MGEWQPIETAPKDGSRILLLRRQQIVCGYWRRNWGEPYWAHDAHVVDDARWFPPTHWMPLPDPPDALNLIEKESK